MQTRAYDIYKQSKTLFSIGRLGEISLILFLLWIIWQNISRQNLPFLTAVFLFGIIVVITNIIAWIMETRALKEIENNLSSNSLKKSVNGEKESLNKEQINDPKKG